MLIAYNVIVNICSQIMKGSYNSNLKFEITRKTQSWAHMHLNPISQVLMIVHWIPIMPSEKSSQPIPFPQK